MLSEKMTNALNEQLSFELASGHIYLSMAATCAAKDLDGFANFFIVQEQEERYHGMRFFNYINERGGEVKIHGLDQPETEFSSIVEIFEKSLHHERLVTSRINDLMTLAREENDYATQDFLQWFVREQVEEEASIDSLLKKIQLVGGKGEGMLMLDNELAQRTFTPPSEE